MHSSQSTTSPSPRPHRPPSERVHRLIHKRSFATLATSSPAGRPHVAGVLYQRVDDALYVSTLRSSRKARNIAANPAVAVSIAVRRVPVGPPSTIQFQAEADILAPDDPHIVELASGGNIDSITGHGELELPDGCFLRIPVGNRLVTYGIGMPLRTLISDPMGAGGFAA